jgi:hypothetical protein
VESAGVGLKPRAVNEFDNYGLQAPYRGNEAVQGWSERATAAGSLAMRNRGVDLKWLAAFFTHPNRYVPVGLVP